MFSAWSLTWLPPLSGEYLLAPPSDHFLITSTLFNQCYYINFYSYIRGWCQRPGRSGINFTRT